MGSETAALLIKPNTYGLFYLKQIIFNKVASFVMLNELRWLICVFYWFCFNLIYKCFSFCHVKLYIKNIPIFMLVQI